MIHTENQLNLSKGQHSAVGESLLTDSLHTLGYVGKAFLKKAYRLDGNDFEHDFRKEVGVRKDVGITTGEVS